MSSYSPIVNYASKDGLSTGDPLKRIKGTEITAELNAISAAIASKADLVSPVFTGTPSAPTAAAGTNTTQLATTAFSYLSIANLITGITGVNGWILSAANTPAVYSNSVQRGSIASTGGWSVNAPTSGTAFSIAGVSTANVLSVTQGASNANAHIATDGTVTYFLNLNGASGGLFGLSTNHPFALYTNNTARVSIAAAGNVTVNAPSAGVALTANGFSGANVLSLVAPASANLLTATDGTASGVWFFQGAAGSIFGNTSNHALQFYTNNTARINLAAAGNVTVNAPTSGDALTVTGAATDLAGMLLTGSANNVSFNLTNSGTGGVATWRISATNNSSGFGGGLLVFGQASNQFMTMTTAAGPKVKIADSAGTMFNSGYLEVPQNVQNASYTTVLADASKHIYHTSGSAHTYTIDSNANVAYPIGTTLTFVNENGGGVVTIAITSDTMRLSPGGTTGSRSLAANGRATALKVTATLWQISGSGLT